MSNDAPPFFPADRWKRHKRMVTLPDGTRAIEKRPIVKSCKAINKAGHEVWFPLATGPKQDVENDPYGQAIVFAKEKQGTIMKGRCPQGGGYYVNQHLPESVKNRRPCVEGAKGGPISDANPCQCVLEVMRIRQEDNAAAMKKLEGAARNKQSRDAEIQEAILEQLRTSKTATPSPVVHAELSTPGASFPDPMDVE